MTLHVEMPACAYWDAGGEVGIGDGRVADGRWVRGVSCRGWPFDSHFSPPYPGSSAAVKEWGKSFMTDGAAEDNGAAKTTIGGRAAPAGTISVKYAN